MLEPSSSFVALDDLRLHYLEWDPEVVRRLSLQDTHTGRDSASGSPSFVFVDEDTDDIPIILLHGLGATADTWRLVAQSLAPFHELVAFDLRGHGLSDQPDDGYDLPTIAEDVIAGMARLGLGQVAVVGHGWGARVALAMATRHPALVSHLVLVDCPHVEPRHWPDMTRERFVNGREADESYTSREHFVNLLHREMASFWSPEVEKIVLSYVYEVSDGMLYERLNAAHQRAIRAALWDDPALAYYGRVRCPVLLMPAASEPQPGEEPPEQLEDEDDFAAAKGQMAVQVARVIPHCLLHWMPHSSHNIQLQYPQQLAEAIIQFLQEQ